MFRCKALTAAFIILLTVPPAIASTVTSYTDAGIVEETLVIKNGRAAYSLPSSAVQGSLRVSPVSQGSVDEVRITPVKSDKSTKREIEKLKERRDALKDRLRAIAAKEEIFEKAAKTQSARSPKKTKTNPDPLATIRQGTDYAIAQLESIYRTRRNTEKELASAEKSISRIEGGHTMYGSSVSIRSFDAHAVKVSYIDLNAGWTPSYRIDISKNGEAVIKVIPLTPASAKAFSLSKVKESGELLTAVKGKALKEVKCSSNPPVKSAFSIKPAELSLECPQNVELPPAGGVCFIEKEYFGAVTFPGVSKGKSGSFVCGAYRLDSDNAKGAIK